MAELDVALVLHNAVIVALSLCSPLLAASLLAGLAIAFLQAITQLSDATLSFLPKLVATGVAAWYAGPFMARVLADDMRSTWAAMLRIGGQ